MQMNLISCFWGNDKKRYQNLLDFLDSLKNIEEPFQFFFYFYSDLEVPAYLKEHSILLSKSWHKGSEGVWQKESLFNHLIERFRPKGVYSFIDCDVLLSEEYFQKLIARRKCVEQGFILQGYKELEGKPSFVKAYKDKSPIYYHTGLNWIMSEKSYLKIKGLDYFFEGSGDAILASRLSSLEFYDLNLMLPKPITLEKNIEIDFLDYEMTRSGNQKKCYTNRLIPFVFIRDKLNELFIFKDGVVTLKNNYSHYLPLIKDSNFKDLSLNCQNPFRHYFKSKQESFVDFNFKSLTSYSVLECENHIEIDLNQQSGGEIILNILPYNLYDDQIIEINSDSESLIRIFYSSLESREYCKEIKFCSEIDFNLTKLEEPIVGIYIHIKVDPKTTNIKLSLPRILSSSKI